MTPAHTNELANPLQTVSAHSLDASEVARRLGVDPGRGLEPDDVAERRELYGPNALETVKPRPAWRVLLASHVARES